MTEAERKKEAARQDRERIRKLKLDQRKALDDLRAAQNTEVLKDEVRLETRLCDLPLSFTLFFARLSLVGLRSLTFPPNCCLYEETTSTRPIELPLGENGHLLAFRESARECIDCGSFVRLTLPLSLLSLYFPVPFTSFLRVCERVSVDRFDDPLGLLKERASSKSSNASASLCVCVSPSILLSFSQ